MAIAPVSSSPTPTRSVAPSRSTPAPAAAKKAPADQGPSAQRVNEARKEGAGKPQTAQLEKGLKDNYKVRDFKSDTGQHHVEERNGSSNSLTHWNDGSTTTTNMNGESGKSQTKRADGSETNWNKNVSSSNGTKTTQIDYTDTANQREAHYNTVEAPGRKEVHDRVSEVDKSGVKEERTFDAVTENSTEHRVKSRNGQVLDDRTVVKDAQGEHIRQVSPDGTSTEDRLKDGTVKKTEHKTIEAPERTIQIDKNSEVRPDGTRDSREVTRSQTPDGRSMVETRTEDAQGKHDHTVFTQKNGDNHTSEKHVEGDVTRSSSVQRKADGTVTSEDYRQKTGGREAYTTRFGEETRTGFTAPVEGGGSVREEKFRRPGLSGTVSETTAADGTRHRVENAREINKDGIVDRTVQTDGKVTQTERHGTQNGWDIHETRREEEGKPSESLSVRRQSVACPNTDVAGTNWTQHCPQDLMKRLGNDVSAERVEATRTVGDKSETHKSMEYKSGDGDKSLIHREGANGGSTWEFRQKLPDGTEESQMSFQGLRDSTIISRSKQEGDWKVTTTDAKMKDFDAAKEGKMPETSHTTTRSREEATAADLTAQLKAQGLEGALERPEVKALLGDGKMSLTSVTGTEDFKGGRHVDKSSVYAEMNGQRVSISRDAEGKMQVTREGQPAAAKDDPKDPTSASFQAGMTRKAVHTALDAHTGAEALMHNPKNPWQGLGHVLKETSKLEMRGNLATAGLSGAVGVNHLLNGEYKDGAKHLGNAAFDLGIAGKAGGLTGGLGTAAKFTGLAGVATQGVMAGYAFSKGDIGTGVAQGSSTIANAGALLAGGPVWWTAAAVCTVGNMTWDYNKSVRMADFGLTNQ